MAKPIDEKYLAGLVFKSSKQKKTDEGTANVPTERPLTQADVLDWKDNGPTVTIVTADGQKHLVSKNPKAKTAGKDKASDKPAADDESDAGNETKE